MRIVENTIEIIESRSETEPSKLVGYGAVFYDPSNSAATEYVMDVIGVGQVTERILPTAFDNSLRTEKELRYEHDRKFIIDTTENTMQIEKDSKGIKVTSTIDKTDPQYQTVVAKIKNKISRGMSFGFNETRTKDKWEQTHTGYIRYLVDIDCHEFSIVRNPAYTATNNGLRNSERSEDIYKAFEKYRTEEIKNRYKGTI